MTGTPGLRQRKKAKTRAAIQQHALRLFREHGYDATTVNQIAEAAEVSESTFFRYFPTKEDVVLWDNFDSIIVDAFRAQPTESTPVQAIRGAFRDTFAHLSESDQTKLRERILLLLSIPPLRATLLDQINGPMRTLAQITAERFGRQPDDLDIRALAGAVIGVGLAAILAVADDPDTDSVSLLDTMLAQLEACPSYLADG